jgi:hypothetical protein
MAAVDPAAEASSVALPGLGRALVSAGKLGSKSAEEIYRKFLSPSSNYEINVDEATRLELQTKFEQEPGAISDVHVFDALQNVIWEVMETDCFPKFMRSPIYEEYKRGTLLLLPQMARGFF